MCATGFRIENFDELRALHRVIMEAKFGKDPMDTAISGSPLVAAVANRVVDALTEMEREIGGDDRGNAWVSWREVTPERREWSVALSRVDLGEPWSSWSREEKARFARILLSPLRASAELIDAFIQKAEGTAD